MKCHIKKGDLVKINPDHCYGSYTQFIKKHIQYAIRWSYKCVPKENRIYKVLGVYKHCMTDIFDVNERCVVVEDTTSKQIFLMGEKGVRINK